MVNYFDFVFIFDILWDSLFYVMSSYNKFIKIKNSISSPKLKVHNIFPKSNESKANSRRNWELKVNEIKIKFDPTNIIKILLKLTTFSK